MQKAIVLMAVSVAFSMATYWVAFAQSPQNQTEAAQVVEVSAKKYEFNPSEIHVRNGTRVVLKTHSEDNTHGMKLDVYREGTNDKRAPGLLFEQPNENGKVIKHVDQVIDFVAQEPGTYDFKCAKLCGLGHDRMKGKLIVEP
jgi:cytochrome c oxidase subunit 2